jgi:formylglycine-generating enzyme required for sulfatase activity
MRNFYFNAFSLAVCLWISTAVAENVDCNSGFLTPVEVGPKPCIKPGSGQSFKDCPECPEMVVVPAGSFWMGSPRSEQGRFDDEEPQHQVTLANSFAVGKFTVTFAEWDACTEDGGCKKYRPDDRGWGRGAQPVIHVNWDDATAYVSWLSRKTGKDYHLLSEAEWEYAARAGTATRSYWGDSVTAVNANCADCNNQWQTTPVGSFKPNAWGLYDMLGNVWQWTEDCWNGNYSNAPKDGSAVAIGDCSLRVIRGGGWMNFRRDLRCANRYRSNTLDRASIIGFRVARTL